MARARRDARVCGALKVVERSSPGAPSVTRNISATGIFLVVKNDWRAGQEVTLDISHRYCELTVRARVVHRQANGAGLEFVDLDPDRRKKLAFIVDGLLADGAWFDERRACLRTGVGGPVVWRLDKIEVQSQLRDLSDGGAFIETSEPPEIGATVVVYLPALGDRKEARGCQATVVHRSEEGFGVEFVFPSAEFSVAVTALLEP